MPYIWLSKASRSIDAVDAVMEDWATFEFDPKAWRTVLTDIGCDDASQHTLFLLAQKSKDDANECIWKILKKVADRTRVESFSALLHSICKEARYQLSWDGVVLCKS